MFPRSDRRARLSDARLYLITGLTPGGRPLQTVLAPALSAGVDVFQLREKEADDLELLAAAREARALTQRAGALFVVNDRPSVAVAAAADGVHLGQGDMDVARAREIVGPDLLIGLSTHTLAQIEGAAGADYIGVGPVHATPTKPGRPAVGLELVGHAARHAQVPFFAIGGIDAPRLPAVVAAGARRVAVVRAIAEASDPRAAARELRAMLTAPVRVGARVGSA